MDYDVDGRFVVQEKDCLGRVVRRREPYHAGAIRYWTSYDYDLPGRATKTTLSDDSSGSGGANGLTRDCRFMRD